MVTLVVVRRSATQHITHTLCIELKAAKVSFVRKMVVKLGKVRIRLG